MTGIFKTLDRARNLDKAVWENKDSKYMEKYNARRNANGRKFIIGSIVGVCRVISSVVKIAFASIGATFCLAGALISSPLAFAGFASKSGARSPFIMPCLASLVGAKNCGLHLLDGVLGVARGIVEIVPFTGYRLAKYDIEQHGKRMGLEFQERRMRPEHQERRISVQDF